MRSRWVLGSLFAVVGAFLSVLPASSTASVALTGRYILVHADARHALPHDELQFFDVGGHLYRLHGVALNRFRPETKLVVRGTISGNTVTAAETRSLEPPVAPSATGAQSVLVIDAVWGSQTLTTTQSVASNFVFGTADSQRRSMNQYYQDVSYGQVSWSGQVTTTLTIPDPGSCSLDAMANAADAAATNAGYTLSNYAHHMYNFPSQYCGNAAWGQVGGPRSWISNGLADVNDGYERMKPAHEIGHNFGLWHGHGLDCGPTAPSSSCITGATGHRCDDGYSAPCVSEYGDSYDLMGNDWTSDDYDAVNWMSLREQLILGWSGGRTASDADPGTAADHLFSVGPIERSSGNIGLVITSGTRNYYLEYRQPLSQDGFLTHWPDATTGVLISSSDNVDNDNTTFGAVGPLNLDTSPNSCLADQYCEWHDAALNVGQTFTDIGGRFTISVNSVSTTGASVTVHWAPSSVGDTTPPAITKRPAQHFNIPSAVTSTGLVPVAHDFAGTDASGVCGYHVSEAVNAGAFVNVWNGTAQTVVRNVAPGGYYQYGVTATDCASPSNTSTLASSSEGPYFALGQYQETAASVVYTGTWTRQAVTSAWGGYEKYATAAGAWASLTVTARNIAWVATKASNRGSAKIYVDGVLKTTVNLQQTNTQNRQLVYKVGWSTPGTHTVKIIVVGTAGHPRVDLDGLAVIS
jgi:hypothetical protein